MNYDYVRPELLDSLEVYQLTTDCYKGERAVKQIGRMAMPASGNGGGVAYGYGVSKYLPDPSPANEHSEVRKSRYRAYLERAVFYNVTKRTVKSMVSAVFAKYPVLNIEGLEFMEYNVCGAGNSIAQQARDAMTEVLLKGRAGLLADMPSTNAGVSKADMVRGNIRPVIRLYEAESIINWRISTFGAVSKLSLIVLAESYVKSDDGFKQEMGRQLLILRLNEQGLAESEIVRQTDDNWVSEGVNPLTDQRGRQLDELPFYFVGADNNNADIDDAPIYDIAQLNIAHFRDSADYQESNFIAGQPTLVISGLDQGWADTYLKDGVSIGARSGILLPQGGSAQLLQAQANSINMESMLHKERQMTTLGAKLIEVSSSSKTATEANQDNAEETSVLSNITNNVSDAYTKAVKMCGRFAGIEDKDLAVILNTEFGFNKMTPEQRSQLMAEWQGGLITFSEARAKLVDSDVATIENPEDAQKIIEQEQGTLVDQTRLEDSDA